MTGHEQPVQGRDWSSVRVDLGYIIIATALNSTNVIPPPVTRLATSDSSGVPISDQSKLESYTSIPDASLRHISRIKLTNLPCRF